MFCIFFFIIECEDFASMCVRCTSSVYLKQSVITQSLHLANCWSQKKESRFVLVVLACCSVQEEVPDACGLNPGDIGSRAGEDAGLVLHSAADWPEAHHAVHLPAVSAQLAQQWPTGVALRRRRRRETSFKRKCRASPP